MKQLRFGNFLIILTEWFSKYADNITTLLTTDCLKKINKPKEADRILPGSGARLTAKGFVVGVNAA